MFFPAAALCLALLMVSILYLRFTRRPASTETLDFTACTITLTDGTAVTPDDSGALEIPAGATVYASFPLPGDGPDQLVAAIRSGSCDVALLLDGREAADPSGRFTEGSGFSEPTGTGDASTAVCTLDGAAGRTLTVAVQFLTAEPSLAAMPQIVLYDHVSGYDSQALSAAADAALPAGVFLAAAIFLMALFLLLLWRVEADWGLLLLALCSLAFCLSRTVTYSLNSIDILNTPVFAILAQNLPTLPLLWVLWIRLSGRLRLACLAVPLASTLAAAVLFAMGFQDYFRVAAAITLMQQKLLPLAMLLLFLAGGADAVRRKGWYRRFFKLAGILLAFVVAANLVGLVFRGRIYSLAGGFSDRMMLFASLFQLQRRLSYMTLMVSFILAFSDYVRALARKDSEHQVLALQSRFAMEHADALYRTLLETRAVRHEIRSRTETLRILCQEGDLDRIRAYAAQFAEESKIMPGLYTANVLANALIAPRLQAAQDAGIQVTALVQLPESLPISDMDLATLLTNLLDNAVVAATAVPEGHPRRLTLRMEIAAGQLCIYCRNSCAGPVPIGKDGLPRSSRGEQHGFGMNLMRRTVEKYHGSLEFWQEGDAFTVQAILALPESQ